MVTPAPRPGILDIAAYVGGVSKLAGVDKVVKLSSNEGALGPSPRALAALKAQAGQMHRYPDGHAVALRQALAARWSINAEAVVCGNGSDDVLQLLVHAYAGQGDEVLYSQHGFLIYPIAAKAVGATPVAAPERELVASVDQLLAAVTAKTRIVFIANPNNPTGTYLSAAEMRRLREGLPDGVLLVIDAAYAEFVNRSDYNAGIELVESRDDVVMTRTFSKIYAMGGLRLGWAYCPPAIADVLNRIRGPFNVSSAAQAAGVAAVLDDGFVELAQRHNEYWRDWLAEQLVGLGLTVVPSVANFLLVGFPREAGRRAADADVFLRGLGIIVRDVTAYGLPDYLRITIGQGAEMQAVADALGEFLGG
ncbi:MAG TPA: histidinol-phosphate transaminase [Rhodospirillaceae bacterium]|nr:histidinol-phosphate transaminase [Rhodospirillaceae bacterium]